jgi:hypothetical protein
MPKRLKPTTFIAAAVVAAVAVVILYAVVQPESDFGVRLFRLRYEISRNRPNFLTSFSGVLSQFGSGSIPDPIDTYLVSRFVSTPLDAERAGIADFYVRQQQRGRPGNHLHNMGERFVEQLFQRLPHYHAQQQLAAIATIEGCRQAGSIGKFYFTPLASAVEDRKLPLETVIAAYNRWWHTPLPWLQKVALNPIVDLPYDWSEP